MHGQTSGSKWTNTNDIEIRAYIGLMIEAGMRKQGLYDYSDFWDPLFGTALYWVSMSKNRFFELCTHLRFDDPSTRSLRRNKDKFPPIRTLCGTSSHY